jgi:cyanophycinase-like exopeptidase
VTLTPHPGLVVLFGSGETSPNGGRIFENIVQRLSVSRPRIAILETPAGFEPNSDMVAGRIANFLRQRLQNYQPEISVIPARKRDTPFSPDNAELTQPLLQANLIFLGPGSPTYTVRQLEHTRAWHRLAARCHLGTTLVLASAATLAMGTQTLPVYEIYKVGADLHWHRGLDFFGGDGLPLVFIPHWDNAEGGADLDTSRCFMGQARFDQLCALLPPEVTLVGIDEHTALIIDRQQALCEVMGRGHVTIIKSKTEQRFAAAQRFPLTHLGAFQSADLSALIPAEVWEEALVAQGQAPAPAEAPAEVLALVTQRQAARDHQDWSAADEIRQRIAALGWKVEDTPEGPRVEPG